MTAKEALENVKHEIQQRLNDMVVDGCDLGSVLAIESFIRSNLEVIEKALTELEELKKRDTPMKLTQSSRFTTDKKLYGMYACNNCHNVVPYININNKYVKPNFCYRCGQRLDWSDKK